MKQPELITPSEALNRVNPPQRKAEQASTTEQIARHGYIIGQYHFLVAKETRAEVIDNSRIYPVPKTQTELSGLINVRGALIPVFELYTILDEEPKKNRHTLVLGQGNKSIALLVDELPRQPTIVKQVKQLPPVHESAQNYVSSAFLDASNTVWFEFDCEQFLLDNINKQ